MLRAGHCGCHTTRRASERWGGKKTRRRVSCEARGHEREDRGLEAKRAQQLRGCRAALRDDECCDDTRESSGHCPSVPIVSGRGTEGAERRLGASWTAVVCAGPDAHVRHDPPAMKLS